MNKIKILLSGLLLASTSGVMAQGAKRLRTPRSPPTTSEVCTSPQTEAYSIPT